jgi:hypothetical protein
MDGFGKWVERVKQEAEKHGRVFVLECFEGHERNDAKFTDGLEVQDLSGFLLSAAQASEFAEMIRTDAMQLRDMPGIDAVFVTWAMDGDTLQVIFERASEWAVPERMAL